MNAIYTVIAFLSGIGVFLYGMKTMSENIKAAAGANLTKNLSRFTNTRAKGFSFGIVFTAIIQSSTATVAITVGFASAGILTLAQTIPVIFGANIGTIVTEFLISFNVFKITEILAALSVVGVFIILFAKSEKTKNLARFLVGIGLMFIGIKLMSDSTAFLKTSPVFNDFILNLKNPLAILLVGFIVTVILQSSLGFIVVLITLAGGGNISLYQAAFFLLGANIGTTMTALLAAVGGSINAKRAAFIHLGFNVFAAIIFSFSMFFNWVSLIPNITSNVGTQIVIINLIFKTITALILLPFVQYIDKMVRSLIKERPDKSSISEFIINEKVFEIPALAVSKLSELNLRLLDYSEDFLSEVVLGYQKGKIPDVSEINARRDFMLNAIFKLHEQATKIMQNVQTSQSARVAEEFKFLSEMQSIVKHLYMLYDATAEYLRLNEKEEIDDVFDKFHKIVNDIILSGKNILKENYDGNKNIGEELIKIIELEENLAISKTKYKKMRIEKLKHGEKLSQSQNLIVGIVTEFEEVGSKIANLAISAK